MTKTTVKTIQANGTWEGQYGTMYQFEVELADGTLGEANSKSQTPPYSQGSTVWYDVKGENQYGKKLKISTSDPDGHKQKGGFAPQGSDTQMRIENSWAVGIAVQVLGPLPQTGVAGSNHNGDLKEYLQKVSALAPKLLEMRDNVSKPAEAPKPVKQQTEPRGDMAQQFNESQENHEDGLPF